MPTAVWAPAALGAIGLMNSGRQADRAADLQERGLKLTDMQAKALKEIFGEVKGHDFGADTKEAVDYATEVTGDTLSKTLSNLNAKFRAGGGSPSGDSEFQVQAQGQTNRVTDPLRAFAANTKSNEFMRKLQALQMAAGGTPGQVANSYFGAANNVSGTNSAPSMQLLAGALDTFLASQRGASSNGGAGGSGDAPNFSPGMNTNIPVNLDYRNTMPSPYIWN
jgi:hypothetical protein